MERHLESFVIGKKEILAARMAFFIPGFAISTWAPMIPMVKEQLQLEDDVLGLLLLCIGVSAFIIMPIAGFLGQRFGCKRVMIVGSMGMALTVVGISLFPNIWLCAILLALLGIFMGTLDVNMNVNAVIVEKIAKRRLMSGMHAFWSIGCFVSAGLFSLLAKLGLSAVIIASIHCLIIFGVLLICGKSFLNYKGVSNEKIIAIPRGIVILFGILACISFLGEGAVMDWSGVFLTEIKSVELSLAGVGYAIFSVAMLVVRLIGDKIVQILGEQKTVIWGTLLSGIGFFAVIFIDEFYLLPLGFIFIGLGAANIVPVLYSLLKHQHDMPINNAVTAITSMGYTGVILGPAVLGFIAHGFGITSVFILLGILFCLQVIIAHKVFKKLI